MGDPKKSKRAYVRPNRPWDKERIEEEKVLMKTYGLRRKKEIWKAQTILSDYRRRARELIASKDETKAKILLTKLYSIGLLDKNATIDDVLDLKVVPLLERRIQTIIIKTDLANTPRQARQFIVHGHISIKDQRITTPSYIVKIDEEKDIRFVPNSSLTKTFVLSKSAKKKNEEKRAKPEKKADEPKDAIEEIKEVVEKATIVDKAIESVE